VLFWTLLRAPRTAPANPWNEWADTLEWTLPSPPPEHTFEVLPKRSDWDKSHAH
jgi:cytochrome c oxidase subunit 1